MTKVSYSQPRRSRVLNLKDKEGQGMTTQQRKTAIVTGASEGIGAGLVEAFLKRGYNVVGNSRNMTKANPFPTSANLALVDGDIGNQKTAAKIADTAVSRFDRIDVLVNNAGIFIPKPFTEYTTEDFNALVSTTLAGFLYVSQVSGEADVASEEQQHRQCINYFRRSADRRHRRSRSNYDEGRIGCGDARARN